MISVIAIAIVEVIQKAIAIAIVMIINHNKPNQLTSIFFSLTT